MEIVEHKLFNKLVHGHVRKQTHYIDDSARRHTIIVYLTQTKGNDLEQDCQQIGTSSSWQKGNDDPRLPKQCEPIEQHEHENQEWTDVLHYSLTENNRCCYGVVDSEESVENEPAGVVGSVLQAHHFHALARL